MPSGHRKPRELGQKLATLLHRAWDPEQVSIPPDASDEALLALLLKGAAGGLAHHPLRACDPERFPAVDRLRQQHRLELMQGRLRERCLADTFTLLREAGVEPLLIKGWTVARLYPDPGMRPYGDLDLCVRDEDYERATGALQRRVAARAPVDLHRASCRQGDVLYGALFNRSRTVPLNGVDIRVPSDEEHLRLLTLHMLSHGAWRPHWLCDIAVALESRTPQFDWMLCLQGDSRLTPWVLVMLRLAHELLGARLDDVPAECSEVRAPRWVVRDVLDAWGRGRSANMDAPAGMHLALGGPVAFARAIRANWRNSVQASYELRAPVNGFPRLPYRIVASFARLPSAVRAALSDQASRGSS
ncbi:MAG: nucleotidyltransferase family protein [Actinomycetota bacterium]